MVPSASTLLPFLLRSKNNPQGRNIWVPACRVVPAPQSHQATSIGVPLAGLNQKLPTSVKGRVTVTVWNQKDPSWYYSIL